MEEISSIVIMYLRTSILPIAPKILSILFLLEFHLPFEFPNYPFISMSFAYLKI